MPTVIKDAAKDAAEFAAAQMSYGEGAGTRRKLIESAVNYKAARIPGYSQAFDAAYAKQDLMKHIKNAKRHRTISDVGALTSKNVRALARGDRHSLSTPVLVSVLLVGVAIQTGYDKKIYAYAKDKSSKARAWLKRKL